MIAAEGMLEALSRTDNSQTNIKEDWDLHEVLKFCSSSEPTSERRVRCSDGQEREFSLGGEE